MNDKKNPVYSGTIDKKKQKKNSLLRHERQIKAKKKKSTQAQEPISVVTNQLKDKYSEIC